MYDHHCKTRLVLAALVLLGCTSGMSAADERTAKARDQTIDDQRTEVGQDLKELSVPPLDHVVYPESRPEWIGNPVHERDNVSTFVVVSGPCETRDESLRALKLMRRAALSTFIENVVGALGSAGFYQVSDKRFDEELTQRRYSGEVTVGGMTQYEDAVEIRITESERDSILDAWKNTEVTQRMAMLGVVTVGGFLTLVASSAVFGIAIRRRERKLYSTTESA
ncbi:MAG: hypothetical protein CMM01_19315 [Rhodopirellula sp.]|nr:hypothetical protein [Rhodopirellula sp.]OUX49780.1 MAG: hypothetical protein CBE43_09250 [Rhodopirellula sp. TMED283]